MAIPDRATAETLVWPGHATQPLYETPMYRIGRKGIDLVAAIDDLDPTALSRMQNLRSTYGGHLEVRPGQAALATTGGTRVHSLYRLNDPSAGLFARFAGNDARLERGVSGALTNIDSGYSGDPLCFCGVTMPLAGTPFVFVGDRSRNRKADRTNAVTPIGLAPATLTSTALVAQFSKLICGFDAADASAAASWTYTAGQDRSAPPAAAGTPTGADVMGAGNLLVQVTTDPGGAVVGYDSIISIARTLNLTTFSGGQPATDDDMTHLIINVSDPTNLEEIKIYLVTSPFTPGAVPGNSANNVQAWFKSIRANDFADYHNRTQSGLDASDDLRLRELLEDFKDESSVTDRRNDVTSGIVELSRTFIPQFPAGRNVWGFFGELGIPLRRGDWARVGLAETASTSWATITGIVIVIQTVRPEPITITFSDWELQGGQGPDTSDAGYQAYDYRVINYHPATGTKGNPSAIQAEAAKVNPVRQAVTITPGAGSDAALRQRAYRRGGSAATSGNWFFVGQNSANGGAITDTSPDNTAATEETLEIDNDQPVTSVSAAGATVLNQTVGCFFQVEDYTFACRDPLQPGRLYRSKKGMPEQWPATDYQDVCAGTEELMNGGQIGSQGFVFSRTRMYSILINSDGSWTTEPTNCTEGLVSYWAMAVTPFGVAFVSPFGVRLTTGGAPDRLSDDLLEPLFRGEAIRGMNYIDFAVPTALQLAYIDDELWLFYQDSAGSRRQLIWNFFDKTWRPYLFTEPIACGYAEPLQGATPSILLGGNASSQVYTHSGFNDDGAAIAYFFRTGAYDWGQPRNEKRLSEIVIDGEIFTSSLTTQAFVNNEASSLGAQTVVGTAGAKRYSFEPFTVNPTRARNCAVHVSGSAPTNARPYFSQLGISQKLEPEITFNQATPWEELPGGEGYVWGCLITCDTADQPRTVLVEYTTNNGSVTTAATLTVQANGRRKLPFSWASVLAQQIRLQPTGTCEPWIRYKVEWLTDPEPPRVRGWDTNWESFGTMADKWLKGYLLEADTFNLAKTVVIDLVDSSSAQLLAQQSNALTFNGRGVQQVSFAKLRGRLFRLRATDNNFGKFYKWQPIFDEEPLALTRWESQEIAHQGYHGWQKPLECWITLRSSAIVTLQITAYGLSGAVLNTSSYQLPSTGGVKAKVRVPLNATKGLLFVYLFTAASAFWLYREEAETWVEAWDTGEQFKVQTFGNDDLDPPRAMGNAPVAASTPGGA